ncbi:MAG: dodecin domain-containing protein [Candidatus Hodarchaeota archaeon]
MKVVTAIGEAHTSWEDAAKNALQNALTDLGPNDPLPGTFRIEVKTFSTEGSNSALEGGIEAFKVQTTITFKEEG